MSESFARGGGGKNAFCSTFPFCSFVVALFSSVGTNVEVGMLSMYFLICHIVLPSALFTNSFHVTSLARVISEAYLFAFALHAALSISCFVRRYTFLNRLASRRNFVSFSFHHLLLWGHGFFRGVVACIVFVMALTSSSAC